MLLYDDSYYEGCGFVVFHTRARAPRTHRARERPVGRARFRSPEIPEYNARNIWAYFCSGSRKKQIYEPRLPRVEDRPLEKERRGAERRGGEKNRCGNTDDRLGCVPSASGTRHSRDSDTACVTITAAINGLADERSRCCGARG